MKFNRNKAFTLLEMVMVMGIMTVIALQEVKTSVLKAEQAMARGLGNELYTYSNGARAYLSENLNAELIALGSGGSVVKLGTGWLKTPACGGTGIKNYVPCHYKDITTLARMPLNMTVSENAGSLEGVASIGPLEIQGEIRQELSALAALTAAGGSLNTGISTGASLSSAFMTDPNGLLVPLGHVEINLSGGGSGAEAWLRVDGGNQMQANITFDPAMASAMRGLVNVSNLSNTNLDGANDQVTFGSSISFDSTSPIGLRNIENVNSISNSLGDLQLNNSVDITGPIYDSGGDLEINDNMDISGYIHNSVGNLVLDDDIDITGYLRDTNGAVIVNDDLEVTGNTDLIGRLFAYDDAYFDGTVDNYDNVTNHADQTTYGDSINNAYMFVGDYLRVQNHMFATRMIDADDILYYVDPNSTSVMNEVLVTDLTADNISASVYYDRDRPAYYANPDGYSRMYGLETTYIRGGADNVNFVGIYENYLGFYPDGDTVQKWQGNVNADRLQIQTIDYLGNSMTNTEALSHMLPRFVLKGIFRIRHGDYIEKPVCPSGTPKILLTPAAMPSSNVVPVCYFTAFPTGNIAFDPLSYTSSQCYRSKGEYRTWAVHSGAYWRTYSYALPDGNPGYAMAQTFCQMY